MHRDRKHYNILIANDDQAISKYQTMKKSLNDDPGKGAGNEDSSSSPSSKQKRKGHRDRKLVFSTVGALTASRPRCFCRWPGGYTPSTPSTRCRRAASSCTRKYFKISCDAKLSKGCADLMHNLLCSYRQIQKHDFFHQVPRNKLKAGMKQAFIPNDSNFEQIDPKQNMDARQGQAQAQAAKGKGAASKKDNLEVGDKGCSRWQTLIGFVSTTVPVCCLSRLSGCDESAVRCVSGC